MFAQWFQKLKGMFAELAPGYGRGEDFETLSIGSGDPQPRLETYNPETLWSLTQDPYIFAGIRSRSIGRLWVSANGIGDVDNQQDAYIQPQILYPPFRQDANPEHLEFVRWQFDEGLTEEGLRCIIDQIQFSYLAYGRAVIELDWTRTRGGKYPDKIALNNLWVRDPARFVIDPKGLQPGVYLKKYAQNSIVDDSDRMPARKFAVLTSHKMFGSPYGLSLVAIVQSIQNQLYNTIGFYARGLERSGTGAIIGKYPKEYSGKGADAKARRQEFIEELSKLKSSTVTAMSNANEVQELSTNINDAAFASLIGIAISQISLVLTGDPTTLKESKFGTYAANESTGVRVKTATEQDDVTLINDLFNYQIIPWLLEWNWNVEEIDAYPMMQIIAPELIQPTISAAQPTQEIADVEEDEAEAEADAPETPDMEEDEDESTPAETSDDATRDNPSQVDTLKQVE